MSLAKRLLPPDEAEADRPRDTIQTGMSLEDAIHAFITIDSRFSELSAEKKRALEILLPAAFEVRGQSNTTRLTSSDQKSQLKIEFGVNYKCDPDKLNTVKELLGDDVFEGLFKTEYAPKLQTLRPFLASKSTDERIETAKLIIKEAVTTTERAPQIKIEKGRIERPF